MHETEDPREVAAMSFQLDQLQEGLGTFLDQINDDPKNPEVMTTLMNVGKLIPTEDQVPPSLKERYANLSKLYEQRSDVYRRLKNAE